VVPLRSSRQILTGFLFALDKGTNFW
jgi:hypothetical protein